MWCAHSYIFSGSLSVVWLAVCFVLWGFRGYPFVIFFSRMPWPLHVRIRAVHLSLELGSATRARRALIAELGRRGAPPLWAITRGTRAFEETGSVQSRPHTRRSHRLTTATLRALRRALRRRPKLSVRRLAARIGVPPTTVHRAIRQQVGLFPYKLPSVEASFLSKGPYHD